MDDRGFVDAFPVCIRVGSYGAGVGIGCGVGIGVGRAIDLGAIPGVGQLTTGLSGPLGQISNALGGATTGARVALRRLGIKGLDAGTGCGVGLGYGFGAGLFLKPSATRQLMQALESSAGMLQQHVTNLTQAAQARLQQAGVQLPGPAPPPHPSPAIPGCPSSVPHTLPPTPGATFPSGPHSTPSLSSFALPLPSPSHPSPPTLPSNAAGLHSGLSALTLPHNFVAGGTDTLPPRPPLTQQHQQGGASPWDGEAQGRAGRDARAEAVALAAAGSAPGPSTGSGARREATVEELRTLLRHERQIARLKAQNRALRRAVCQLRSRLPICKERSDGGDSGSSEGW